jgi:hypothetical protein
MYYVLIDLETNRIPTLVPSMTELIAFYGRIYSPLGILPNLPIELGCKTILINVVVMNGLVD